MPESRSLYDDGAKKPENVTRDYHLTLDERFREAPVLTIYGGKITTYRRVAEAVLHRLGTFFLCAASTLDEPCAVAGRGFCLGRV